MAILELVSALLLIAGAVVVLLGSIGLIRFPDFFCRLHSAGVIDTLGAWLLLGGLLLVSDSVITVFKVLLIAVLLFVLSPVGSHMLSRAALEAGKDDSHPHDEGHPLEELE